MVEIIEGRYVAVLGDLNIDLLLRVDFIPTADIAVAAKELRIDHGGVAGNLAVALSRLGVKSRVIGAVGRDVFGSEIINRLRRDGVDTRYVKVIKEVPTGIMVVLIVPSGMRTMLFIPHLAAYADADAETVSVEPNKILGPQISATLHTKGIWTIIGFRGANAYINLSSDEVNEVLRDVIHVHISGYTGLNNDGGSFMLKLARISKELGMSVSVDLEGIAIHKKNLVNRLRGTVDYVMLNGDELKYLSGCEDIEEGLNKLDNTLKPKAIFLKLGPRGSMVYYGGVITKVEPFKVRAIDSTGAGDAFNAGVIYGLLRGLEPTEAAKIGNAMGAYACLGSGARYLPRGIDELVSMFKELSEIIR